MAFLDTVTDRIEHPALDGTLPFLHSENTSMRYLHVAQHFKHYIDDRCGIVAFRTEAEMFLQAIADKDPHGKLFWESEFQVDGDTWIKFLDTEVIIATYGNVKSRLYRKPQKRKITLHVKSRHPTSIKTKTIKNSYSDARKIRSGKLTSYTEAMGIGILISMKKSSHLVTQIHWINIECMENSLVYEATIWNKDITFIQFFHSTPLHSTELFKIVSSLLTLQLLFCKKLVGREKIQGHSKINFKIRCNNH